MIRVAIDTNVLVYAEESEPSARKIAATALLARLSPATTFILRHVDRLFRDCDPETHLPRERGLQFVHGIPVGLGAHFPISSDVDLRGGYWIIPLALFFGMGILVGTHRGARRYLAWWRGRRLT